MKKVLLGLLVLAVLYGGGVVYVASRLEAASAARATQDAQVAALGEKVAAEVRAIDSQGASLKEACAGKLTEGGARSLVEYALALPEGERPSLDGESSFAAQICALTDTGSQYLEMTPMDPPRPRRGWDVALARSVSPDDWARLLEGAADDRALYDELRYVLVAHFSDLTPARIELDLAGQGTTFDPGRSRYRARVISFPGGETVCQGTGEGRLEQKEVIGRGSSAASALGQSERKLADAWHKATVASPLHDLCATGGKSLCFATNLAVDAPDW
jgi:hypothetical protein